MSWQMTTKSTLLAELITVVYFLLLYQNFCLPKHYREYLNQWIDR